MVNSNLGPILHRLVKIHPLQTTTNRQTTTDDNRAKDALQHSCSASTIKTRIYKCH